VPIDNSPQERFVREPERAQITGIPTSSWYTMQQQGLAPRPYHIGPRTVAWRLSELNDWIKRQTAAASVWQKLGEAAAQVVFNVAERVELDHSSWPEEIRRNIRTRKGTNE
jgi:prophage regulatory protein